MDPTQVSLFDNKFNCIVQCAHFGCDILLIHRFCSYTEISIFLRLAHTLILQINDSKQHFIMISMSGHCK